MRHTAGFKSKKKGIQIHSPGIEGGEKEREGKIDRGEKGRGERDEEEMREGRER